MNYCRAGIFLLSLLTIQSCGGGGGGDSSPSGAADIVSSSAFVNANGALAGDIWFEGDFDETFRFNLETGTTSKISNFKVSPNPDGTMYVKFE